jgi:hypothetical protein
MNKLLIAATLFLPWVAGTCFAENYPALSPMPKEYLNAPGDVIEVRNMPEVRSQGGLPVCYGITAWYAYMQFQCEANQSDCRSLNPDTTPSPIMLGALGVNKELYEKYGSVYNRVVPYSIGGGDSDALFALNGEDQVWADACFPLDRTIQHFGGSNRKMFNAFENLKSQFFERNKNEGKLCMNCLLDTLHDDFGLTPDQTIVQKALSENVFDKFLFDLFVLGCNKKVDVKDFHLRVWPNMSETASYDNFIAKLRSVLQKNTPVLTSICLDQKNTSDEQCKSGHAVAITGYRKVCAKAASCTEYLKVHNTWGADWQRLNSDGWLDSRTLYEYMTRQYQSRQFIWIE